MSSRESAPASYGDITRATVPSGDGSVEPSRTQVRDSHAQSDLELHEMTGDERAVLAQILAALSMEGHTDLQHVDIQVQGSRVILRGTVPGPSTSARIEDIAGSVAHVAEVWNELDIIPTDPTH